MTVGRRWEKLPDEAPADPTAEHPTKPFPCLGQPLKGLSFRPSVFALPPEIAPYPFVFAGQGFDSRYLRARLPREPFPRGREQDRCLLPSTCKSVFVHPRDPVRW